MTIQEENERLQKLVNELGEHFDAVQLLVCRHEPSSEDGTVSFSAGCGNVFARSGMAAEWLARMDERARCQVRKKYQE